MSDLSVLHDMTLFVEVARTQSFSDASRNLGVPAATLSRRIAAMEREFGIRLFDRNTRRVELSEPGRRYFERCAHLVDEARLAQEALREAAEKPSGHVRLSMPVDLGVFVVGPLLPEFSQQFQGISFDIDLSSRHADLLGEHVDVAIRLGEVHDEHLVARRIGSIEMALYASPAYLSLRGRPIQPADLVQHECITLRGPQRQVLWSLHADAQVAEVLVRGRFMVNNQGLMRQLAERGMGIAALSTRLLRAAPPEGQLEQVLPDWTMPRLPICAVMSSRLQPASVRVLLDFLTARLVVT